MTSTVDSGTTRIAASVICQEMVSIMISTPTTVTTEVMICDRLCERVWLTVSTSLVRRESTSPGASRQSRQRASG